MGNEQVAPQRVAPGKQRRIFVLFWGPYAWWLNDSLWRMIIFAVRLRPVTVVRKMWTVLSSLSKMDGLAARRTNHAEGIGPFLGLYDVSAVIACPVHYLAR